MPSFGDRSNNNLDTCHPDLRALFRRVVEEQDCAVICGIRTKEEQETAFLAGASTKRWPDSKHNVTSPEQLSIAVDVVPYPVDWTDKGRFYMFVGYVKRIAFEMSINIRCGADWDNDGYTKDQKFHDLPHFELN